MITGLDHMVLVCPDIEAGIADYTKLLGAGPVWRHARDGAQAALFQFENTALELLAPDGEDGAAQRLREILEADGPGLKTIVFASDDVDVAHHTSTRRGLAPSEVIDQSVEALDGNGVRRWRRFRLSDDQTHGVKTLVIKYDAPLTPADPVMRAYTDWIISWSQRPIRTGDCPLRRAAWAGLQTGPHNRAICDALPVLQDRRADL